MGTTETSYLHLGYGSDAIENRNLDILDAKALQLARAAIADVPAGGDLEGFYPDPLLAANLKARLAPAYTQADLGKVLTVANGPVLAWAAGGGGGDALWTDDATNEVLTPTSSRSVMLAPGKGLNFNDISAGPIPRIYSDGANMLYLGYQHFIQTREGTNIGWFDEAGLNLPNANIRGGGFYPGAYVGSPNEGSIQFDSTSGHLQAWIAGAWTQLDNQSGGGGGGAPTGAAGGDLGSTYPNPTVVQARANFLVNGAAGVNGLLSVGVSDAMRFGSGTVLGHLIQGNSTKRAEFTFNVNDAGVQDDVSLPSWRIRLGALTDDIQFNRHPAGGAVATLASMTGTGAWTMKDTLTDVIPASGTPPIVTLGTGSSPIRFRIGSITGGNFQFYANATMNNLKDDAAQPSLAWVYDAIAREFGFYGAPAGGSIAWSQMMALNVDGILLPTAGEALVCGSSTGKTRFFAHPTISGFAQIAVNAKQLVSTAWTQDDPSLPSWNMQLRSDTDRMTLLRAPIGSTTFVNLLTLDGAGVLGLPGNTSGVGLLVGAATPKTRVIGHPTSGVGYFSANEELYSLGAAWRQDDGSKPGWVLSLRPDTDQAVLSRFGAGSAISNAMMTIDNQAAMTLGAAGTALVFGTTGTTMGRLLHWGANEIWLSNNRTGARDDLTKSAWVIAMQTSTNNVDNILFVRDNTSGVTAYPFTFGSDGNFIITGTVGQKATGTTWSNPSDRRIKDEITDYPTGLDIVLQLLPRTFVYNGKGGSVVGMRGYGFIADEVAAVMPEMVGTTRTKLDADDEELTDIQTVDQSNLILALVNSVRELAARVAVLEAA